jgi:ATP-binding cassette subfamily F protein 3
VLQVQKITKQYGGKILFENADALISERSRLALIGPNGAGKSTLIKMLLGLEEPDAGSVTHSPQLTMGYLAQEVPKIEGRTVLEETVRMGDKVENLKLEKDQLEEEFANLANPSETSLTRYSRVLEELELFDQYALEPRAKAILSGMGFKESDFNRSLHEFSGGWLMRVALSRILLASPDLLLLDEPTNHLDLESQLWLEEFLCNYQGAILLISHDRAFLNRIANEVWEIDQRKLWSYKGNLDAFAMQKEERLSVLRNQAAGQETKIAELEAFIRRFGAKATKARQAQSRVKQLEKIVRIELPDEQNTISFRFPPAPYSGKHVISAENVSVAYGDKTVFKDLNWVIPRGSHSAIVGINGAGKTSLLKLLAGQIQSATGALKLGHEVKMGYYAQIQWESLDPKKTILEELVSVANDTPIAKVRSVAGAFLFTGDDVYKRCGVLSGGEKARVALAKLLLIPTNFLLLDEPTNHLDASSRDVLREALADYDGTLCLVSHDREFVAPLCDFVLEIIPQPGGARVEHVLGGYEDYLKRKLREASETASRSVRPSKVVASKVEAPNKASAPPSNNKRRAMQQEFSRLEQEIAKLEEEQKTNHELLAIDATYEDKTEALRLVARQEFIDKDLEFKVARWSFLATQLG